MSNPKQKKNTDTSISSTSLFFKFMHHFGDWELETSYMSRIERSIYFDMKSFYLRTGKPLTDDMSILERYLKCTTDEEKTALQFLLADKFTHCKKTKRYKHREWDLMIKSYRYANRNNVTQNINDVTDDVTQNDRVKALRNRNKLMINALKGIGVNVNSRTPSKELQALCEKHNIDVMQFNVTQNNDDVTQNDDDVTDDVTQNEMKKSCYNKEPKNQEPVTNNQNKNKYQSEVLEIFEFWKSVFEKSEKAILSDKRKTKIIERLKDGYTVEQIKQAIYNCSKSEFHVLNNYTDLELICRNVEKLDYFLGLTEQIRANQTGNSVENQPVTPKLDPAQAILCNGLLKPLFPNMNQAQSWNFVNSNRQPYEGLDETYDRLMNDIDWQNFDYSKVAV